ncbi:MAG: DUF2764 family protein [Parachlamydiaceae bacterium]|nr:DUF2764 family protein [Parachlamydiaceae bacterium]
MNYYFLGTLLPELHIGEPPEIGFREYEQLLKENLSDSDFDKTRTIRNLFDILNLRFYWKEEPLNELGNHTESELEEAFATQSMLPSYVFNFMEKYESKSERLQHFPALLSTFFTKEIEDSSGFFKAYLTLERELRLILVAFRAKKLNRDLLIDLQYEDPEEQIIAQMLAQKDAAVYEPPEKYEQLKIIFEKYQNQPLELQKALVEFRFNKIEEMLGLDLFSADRALAYLVELILVEQWQQMDQQEGLKIVDSMLKDIS